jgi:rubredoxin
MPTADGRGTLLGMRSPYGIHFGWSAWRNSTGLAFTVYNVKEVKKMEEKQDEWICAHCGYTADGKFEGDICPQCGLTYWKCAKCGFLITASVPPDVCPECGEKCDFLNVTCYTPECGGPGHVDTRL